jgi:Uma2 family endonuclease
MSVQSISRVTVEEFEAFIQQPENSDRNFELIGGEIVEVPSNPFVSKIAMLIGAALIRYLSDNDIGHVTGEAGGYMVAGERYAPDVAYISYARQSELAQKGYNPNPPDLAVEVIFDPSSEEEQRKLRLKLSTYLSVGVVVWIVNPYQRRIEVHRPGHIAQNLDAHDTLDGGDLLPGFTLAIKDIFKD